jgi:hypothetical protein
VAGRSSFPLEQLNPGEGMRRTLAAALLLFCAWTGIAQAQTTTGRVDATAVRAPRRADIVFHTQSTRDITATLHWLNANATLQVYLARRTRSGKWVQVARAVSRAHPKQLVLHSARAGRYRLRVGAARGQSPFRLVFDAGAVSRPPAARPFLTLLFSRSEIMDASHCRADRIGSINLITEVAPDLARRGIAGTGSVETGITQSAARACVHYKRSLTASWADLARLRDRYGWKFVSHGRTFATNIASLTPRQQWAETCGSLLDLERHGYWSADGLFAYPDNKWNAKVQSDVVSKCFAFGRRYAAGPTTRAQAMSLPHWQRTTGISGGRCNDRALPCSKLATATKYRSPVSLIQTLGRLAPNQWLTLQSYVFVTGDRKGHWRCNARHWRDHWTNDAERYCWNDYRRILSAIPSGVRVTDPETVARAWGRTNFRPPMP